MGRMGSTTSVRARQMRRVLAHWQRSGLTLREFGEKRGIPLSTLAWWRRTYAYEFSDENAPLEFGITPVSFPLGAYHGAEVQYLMNIAGTPATFTTEQQQL